MVDALEYVRDVARRQATVLDNLDVNEDGFLLMTAYGREIVDDPDRFRSFFDGAVRAGREHGLEVVYPIHPHARERLEGSPFEIPDSVQAIELREYLDFVRLLSTSAAVLTDSDEVQEEACVLGIPCATMRNDTERSETTDVGANRLTRCDPDRIFHSVTEMLEADREWENPYGSGDAAERILRTLPVSADPGEIVR